jgi:phosphoribosylanthranilate isomerase
MMFDHFVKICGITTVNDALFAEQAGANAVGLIFATSTRQISEQSARAIADALNQATLTVGVFRGQSDREIMETLRQVPLRAIQSHSPISQELSNHCRAEGIYVIQAMHSAQVPFVDVDALLIDGAEPGSGQLHAWDWYRDISSDLPMIGAGGLTPDNVQAIIQANRLRGVDCASGVELSPGVKDPEKVAAFISNARRAFEELL